MRPAGMSISELAADGWDCLCLRGAAAGVWVKVASGIPMIHWRHDGSSELRKARNLAMSWFRAQLVGADSGRGSESA